MRFYVFCRCRVRFPVYLSEVQAYSGGGSWNVGPGVSFPINININFPLVHSGCRCPATFLTLVTLISATALRLQLSAQTFLRLLPLHYLDIHTAERKSGRGGAS
jgi:hypothetical protein